MFDAVVHHCAIQFWCRVIACRKNVARNATLKFLHCDFIESEPIRILNSIKNGVVA